VPDGLEVYDARSLRRVEAVTAGYDDVVYVLGNGEFHTAALESLRHRRGTVLAHEVRLSGLYRFSAGSAAAVPEGVAGAVRDMYGPLLPEGVAATGEVSPLETELYGLLMAREVIALADRFFVTSPAAARLARIEAGPELASRIGVVSFATETPRPTGAPYPIIEVIEPTARLVASFGIVDPIKQPQKLLGAFALLAPRHPELVLGLVGPISGGLADELRSLGRTLGIDKRLFLTGLVSNEQYVAWMDRASVAVQLRASFSGEASAAAGDCLFAGVPTVVSDIGWMGELPDDAARKVRVDATPGELAQACEALLDDTAALRALGEGARRYAEAHTFKTAARELLEILGGTEAGQSVRPGRSTA
jgi:glycosyltransferase involved in cell wall biosynthesis